MVDKKRGKKEGKIEKDTKEKGGEKEQKQTTSSKRHREKSSTDSSANSAHKPERKESRREERRGTDPPSDAEYQPLPPLREWSTESDKPKPALPLYLSRDETHRRRGDRSTREHDTPPVVLPPPKVQARSREQSTQWHDTPPFALPPLSPFETQARIREQSTQWHDTPPLVLPPPKTQARSGEPSTERHASLPPVRSPPPTTQSHRRESSTRRHASRPPVRSSPQTQSRRGQLSTRGDDSPPQASPQVIDTSVHLSQIVTRQGIVGHYVVTEDGHHWVSGLAPPRPSASTAYGQSAYARGQPLPSAPVPSASTGYAHSLTNPTTLSTPASHRQASRSEQTDFRPTPYVSTAAPAGQTLEAGLEAQWKDKEAQWKDKVKTMFIAGYSQMNMVTALRDANLDITQNRVRGYLDELKKGPEGKALIAANERAKQAMLARERQNSDTRKTEEERKRGRR